MTTDSPPDLIAAKIRESRRIAVTSHLRPDGDSICTSLALALMGEALGKTVDIVNTDKTPFPFCRLADAARIRTGPIDPSLYDAIIFLECADVSRSGIPASTTDSKSISTTTIRIFFTGRSIGSNPRPRPSERWSSGWPDISV
jgi:nanoRNase/pAp phosphatase (c-di-AMP/oligoRNAs hydrolase)